MSISSTLRKAALLQEKIEELRGKLVALLTQARTEVETSPLPEFSGGSSLRRKSGRPASRGSLKSRHAHSTTRAMTTSKNGRPSAHGGGFRLNGRGGMVGKRRVSPLKGKKRSASPSGPLAPAVVRVLGTNSSKPMSVREILDGLIVDGYKFTTTEPKKNLAARIYRLKGVKQVGEGLFAVS